MSIDQDHNYRVLINIGGVDQVFNYPEFKARYERLGTHRGMKAAFMDKVTELTGKSESTIKGWLSGKHGPDDYSDVECIAKLMDVSVEDLLTRRATTNDDKEYLSMREIKDYEREKARSLYEKMCEMIRTAEATPEFDDPEMLALRNCKAKTGPVIKQSTESKPHYFQQEEYRDDLLLTVRKARFDVPKKLRDDLIELINRTFGPRCIDTPHFGDMYFCGEEYKDYLIKNNLENSTDARYVFEAIFVERLYDQLDTIFSEYLIGGE